MIIQKIKISNFGPFRKDHEITFENEGYGVHIFRGGNGQGKTSLQNSIIWGLYGKITNRRGREIPPTSIVNRQARSDGIYSFGVQLFFTHEEKSWILSRRMDSKYHQDRRYRDGEKLYLSKDGDFVNNPQNEIERIFPSSINRFFFFDGEMLRDYEELLEEKSSRITKLKDSIERILGIPFFRLAKDDLKVILSKIERERSKVVRRLGGEEYENVQKQFDEVSVEINDLEKLIETINESINVLDIETLDNKRKQEDYKDARDYAIRRNTLERELRLLNIEREAIDIQQKGLNNGLYKSILFKTSKNILFHLDKKHKDVMSKYDKKLRLLEKLDTVNKGIKSQKCDYCDTILNEDKLKEFKINKKELKIQIEKVTEIPQPDTSFEAYRQTLKRLDDNLINQDEYAGLEQKIHHNDSETASRNQELEELKLKYDPKTAETAIELEGHIRDQEREKGRLEGIITGHTSELSSWREIKSELNQKITSINQEELKTLSKRIDLIKSLIQLFEDSISIYITERQNEIEDKATEIFRNLRSKKDFDKLEINPNYGLSIITTSGEILNKSEWRSAGEEQLVALSLIGALNQCSKIEAPIAMDTPFGRLDLKHGGRVMSYLPIMADQIILFATDREVRDEDLSYLKGNLKSDYTLEHQGENTGSIIKKTR